MLCLLLPTGSLAGVPDWLREAARTTLPSYPPETKALLLLNDLETSVNDAGEIYTVHRLAYRILRPEGKSFGTVVLYFDSDTDLSWLKGWSITASGAEYELKEKDALEGSVVSEGIYSDLRYKLLQLPAANPGSTIGYEYRQRRRPFVQQEIWPFQQEIPVVKTRFVLELPPSWDLRAHWFNHAEVQPQVAANRRVWEFSGIPAIEDESDMPPWRSVAGWLGVAFFPRAQAASAGRWDEIALWYGGLAAPRKQSTPEIRAKVKEVTGDATTQAEKIRRLAEFVQHQVRYVAIEIGIGGYQPHAAGDIFTSRYGDCKDKATLLAVMLQEIGVPSYYVLLHSDRGEQVPEFPTVLTSNHVILAIRAPKEMAPAAAIHDDKLGDLVLFDPTAETVPFGLLPSSLQSSRGVLVHEAGGTLLELPLAPPETNRLERTGKFTLEPSGDLNGEVVEVHSGAEAASLRESLAPLSVADRGKRLQTMLTQRLEGATLVSTNVQGLDKRDDQVVLRFQLLARQYAQRAGDLILLRPRVMGKKSSDILLKEKPRQAPVEMDVAKVQTDRFEIKLPAGYRVDELPEPAHSSYPFAEYKSQSVLENGVLRYERTVKWKDVRVGRDHLDDLKRFWNTIAEDEGSSAVLKSGK